MFNWIKFYSDLRYELYLNIDDFNVTRLCGKDMFLFLMTSQDYQPLLTKTLQMILFRSSAF